MLKILKMTMIAGAVCLGACGSGQDDALDAVQSNGANLSADLGNDFSGNYLFVHGTRSTAVDSKYPCLNEVRACLALDASGGTAAKALQDLCPSMDTPVGTWKFEFALFTDKGCQNPLPNVACVINAGETLFPGDNHNQVRCLTTNSSKDFHVCLYDPATGAGFGHCPVDKLIDCDGIATGGSGCAGSPGAEFDVRVALGARLSDFPVGARESAGLDWMDNDGDHQWTFGIDSLMSEGEQCGPEAIKNGLFDDRLGAHDCIVIQGVPPLFDRQQVSCDIEIDFQWLGWDCRSSVSHIRYFDVNGNGQYDVGEPLILDTNNDGIYN